MIYRFIIYIKIDVVNILEYLFNNDVKGIFIFKSLALNNMAVIKIVLNRYWICFI